MYKHKKILSLVLIILVLAMVLPINALGLYISPILPPSFDVGIPGPKLPSIDPNLLNPINNKAAEFTDVEYQFNPGVKTLPSTLLYQLQPMDLPDIIGRDITEIAAAWDKVMNINNGEGAQQGSSDIFSPSNNYNNLNLSISQAQEILNIENLQYPLDSKFMILNNRITSFNPKVGDIYVDSINNTALKVVGETITNSQGKNVIPIAPPGFDEIFQSYKIPYQELELNEANISYVAPGVAVHEEYMPVALATNGILSLSEEVIQGEKVHKITLKDFLLYEYPNKNEEKGKEEKEQPEPLKKEEEKTQYDDLRGVEDKSELSIKITVEEAIIRIYKPTLFTDIDIGLFTQNIKVGFASKTQADVTIKGELKFNKVIEQCLFGYDIKIPYGKAFVGVFLVVDINGQVDIVVRTFANGRMEAGFKATAIAFVPVYVGPYFDPFIPTEPFDIGFTVDGEVNAKIALTPQVGLIILDCQIGVLQFWMGMKANAKFYAQAGTGGTVNGPPRAEGHLKIDMFTEFLAYILDGKYSVFYKEFNLYNNSWSVGGAVSSGSGQGKIIPARIEMKADAFTDTIEGSVYIYSDSEIKRISVGGIGVGTPYQGDGLVAKVKHKDGRIDSHSIKTDNLGRFKLRIPADKGGLVPQDTVWIEFNANLRQDGQLLGTIKHTTEQINPGVPFDRLSFTADGFNDIVSGHVSGDYNGNVVIFIDNGKTSRQTSAKAVNGEFSTEVQLVGGDKVTVAVGFEGVYFPRELEEKAANIDILKISTLKPSTEGMTASIQNMAGLKKSAYVGNVELISLIVKDYKEATKPKVYEDFSNPRFVRDSTVVGGFRAVGTPTSTSTFSFDKVPLCYIIRIEHEGMVKQLIYDPISEINKRAQQPLQLEITSPIDNKVNPLINPGDIFFGDKLNPSGTLLRFNTDKVTGVWETHWGTITLNQSGNNITGYFNDGDGTLKGTISGNRIIASFDEYGSKGSLELLLFEGGKAMSGKWKYNDDSTWVDMTGKKRAEIVTSKGYQLSSPQVSSLWTGVWYSDYGTIIFVQEGTKLYGTYGYDEHRLEGTITGNTFKGTYEENGDKGKVEFLLYSDGKSFSGRWMPAGETEWYLWDGVKAR